MTTKPGIDPTMQALLDAFPFKFTADDGVEVAREQMRRLKAPPEVLPDMRIEERTIGCGDITNIPVRIYWPPIARHDDLPVVVFYRGGEFMLTPRLVTYCWLPVRSNVLIARACSSPAATGSRDRTTTRLMRRVDIDICGREAGASGTVAMHSFAHACIIDRVLCWSQAARNRGLAGLRRTGSRECQ